VEDREEPADHRRGQDRGVPGQRADPKHVTVVPEVRQLGQVVDVDQAVRPGQPQLHHRQQAVAAGHQPRLRAVLA
jgi:hypothetical protein